jgi:UDPglucose--hexose-1-phosphate uridylyltransferase
MAASGAATAASGTASGGGATTPLPGATPDVVDAAAPPSDAAVGAAAARVVAYALTCGIIEAADTRWAYNRLLETVGRTAPAPDTIDAACGWVAEGASGMGGASDMGGTSDMRGVSDQRDTPAKRDASDTCDAAGMRGAYDVEDDLAVLAAAGVAAGRAEDTAAGRERLAMGAMGSIMPRPSEVARTFWERYRAQGPTDATDWFYRLCCDADYVRTSAIARNLAWTTDTRWGRLEITINKSKPEKDPRDIAAAAHTSGDAGYPACVLCRENEGYAGRAASDAGGHPARQNLRIVPLELGGEGYGLQYSPYAYFDEHCIVMSDEHRPMHVDTASLACLVDFVDLFPHYFIGSNADLPIVGGSILSHDHFQGGRHEFPMMKAPAAAPCTIGGFSDVEAAVIAWPLTVLRLRSASRERVLGAAVRVLDVWNGWNDVQAGVVSRDADGTRHNTVTPICRKMDGVYELYLALRCNVTTPEHPMGLFHPHEDKWRVKKENIGLIEVMGLAILPPRLEAELTGPSALTRDGVGQVFACVLEDAGVFTWDAAGRAALDRFLAALA